MNATTIAIISIFISLVSGVASVFAIMTFFANRAELIQFVQTGPKEYTPMIKGELSADYVHNGVKKSIKFPQGILVHFQFLNPSPKDIAYFHLQFELNGHFQEAWTEKSFSWATDKPKIVLHDILHPADIPFPHEPQGVFKAHSFTPIYAFMELDTDPIPPSADFVIRYAVRKFPFFGKKNHYKTFTVHLDLNGSEEMLKSKQAAMQQLTKSTQKSTKTHQTPPRHK